MPTVARSAKVGALQHLPLLPSLFKQEPCFEIRDAVSGARAPDPALDVAGLRGSDGRSTHRARRHGAKTRCANTVIAPPQVCAASGRWARSVFGTCPVIGYTRRV